MERPKVKCPYCDRLITKSNIGKHIRSHENGNFEKNKPKLTHSDLFCKFCKCECLNKNSLIQHEIRCKLNPDRIETTIKGFNDVGHTAWNKGLTKDTSSEVLQQTISLEKYYQKNEAYWQGKHHSAETKEAISLARRTYLSEHPEKVPYVLNHSSKESYPESYFKEIFNNEGIQLQYHYRINKYELDFCNLEKKVDIEIDGDQHYLDARIRQNDIRRNEFLLNLGWTIYRIRWSDYQKLSLEERHNIILEIKELLQ